MINWDRIQQSIQYLKFSKIFWTELSFIHVNISSVNALSPQNEAVHEPSLIGVQGCFSKMGG